MIAVPHIMAKRGFVYLRPHAIMISLTMILVLFSPMATAFDTDGDGVDDSTDDCPVAYGNSTVDRDGCPDRE